MSIPYPPRAEEYDEPAERAAALVRLSDVQVERVEWLWPGRLPAGKLTVLDGDPSMGKSTLALTLAAHLSTGRPWPDGTPCPHAPTVVLSAEDGLADTVRPRVDAAGGDPRHVHILTAVTDHDEDGAPYRREPTLRDVGAIGEAIERTGARLLIVDVLMAYLGGRTDSHRDQDVRAVLAPLSALADRTGCAVLLLRHLNKAPGGSPLYRGGGSIGIVGACRTGYVVALDPDDEQGARRVLACVKNNLAGMPPSMTYTLEPAPGSHVGRVVWGEASAHGAAELLRAVEDDEERGERDEAVEWLIGHLADQGGAARAGDVIKAARRDGIAERTIKRARNRAGVTSERAGYQGGAMWSLDPSGPHPGHRGQPPQAGTNGPDDGPNDGEAPEDGSAQGEPDPPGEAASRCRLCDRSRPLDGEGYCLATCSAEPASA